MSGQDDTTTTESESTELVSISGPNSLMPALRCSVSIDIDLICDQCNLTHYDVFTVIRERYNTLEEAQSSFTLGRDALTNVGYQFRHDTL